MVRLMRWTVALVVVVLGIASAEAAKPAAKPKKSLEQRFSQLDKDNDNKLSLDEFVGKRADEKKEKATKRFGKLDKDGDKYLSLEEFKAGFKKKN